MTCLLVIESKATLVTFITNTRKVGYTKYVIFCSCVFTSLLAIFCLLQFFLQAMLTFFTKSNSYAALCVFVVQNSAVITTTISINILSSIGVTASF